MQSWETIRTIDSWVLVQAGSDTSSLFVYTQELMCEKVMWLWVMNRSHFKKYVKYLLEPPFA